MNIRTEKQANFLVDLNLFLCDNAGRTFQLTDLINLAKKSYKLNLKNKIPLLVNSQALFSYDDRRYVLVTGKAVTAEQLTEPPKSKSIVISDTLAFFVSTEIINNAVYDIYTTESPCKCCRIKNNNDCILGWNQCLCALKLREFPVLKSH